MLLSGAIILFFVLQTGHDMAAASATSLDFTEFAQGGPVGRCF